MKVCYCTLSGTKACVNCQNNIFDNAIYKNANFREVTVRDADKVPDLLKKYLTNTDK